MPLKLVSASSAPSESAERQALRRGEITWDEFLDQKADKAVARLRAQLSPEDLAAVREAIRLQLELDPRTVEELRELTGHSQLPAEH
jgi:uncharacterized protein YhdP